MKKMTEYLAALLHQSKKPLRERFALKPRALSRLAGISQNVPTMSFPAIESNAWFKVKTVSGGSLKIIAGFLLSLGTWLVFQSTILYAGTLEGRVIFNETTADISARNSENNEIEDAVVWIEGVEAVPSSGQVELIEKDKTFSHRMLTIRPGASVFFVNGDPILNNMRGSVYENGKTKRGLFNLALPKQGDRKEWVFKSPGIYRIESDIYRWLVCWIVVREERQVVVNKDGSFRFERLEKEGIYRVHAWSPKFSESIQGEVEIKDGKGFLELRRW